jgi:hypothetical protein
MSNLSTKILMISFFLRISFSLDCHVCNNGLSEFFPCTFKQLKDMIGDTEEFLKELEKSLEGDTVETYCLQLSW